MKPPPLAFDLKFVACAEGHLHCLLLDEGGKEIGEFIINDYAQASAFSIVFAKAAIDAFDGERNILQ